MFRVEVFRVRVYLGCFYVFRVEVFRVRVRLGCCSV